MSYSTEISTFGWKFTRILPLPVIIGQSEVRGSHEGRTISHSGALLPTLSVQAGVTRDSRSTGDQQLCALVFCSVSVRSTEYGVLGTLLRVASSSSLGYLQLHSALLYLVSSLNTSSNYLYFVRESLQV